MSSPQARAVADTLNPRPELTADPLIDGVENRDEWIAHREIVVEELCPVGALETLYAHRAALFLWRLDRVIGFENESTIASVEDRSTKICMNPQGKRNQRNILPDPRALQTIIKYESHLQRCLTVTMAELRRLQKERRQGLRDANTATRGADRAGNCQNQQLKDGSPGGSPSQMGAPKIQISSPEMSIPGGRGADRVGNCQNQQLKDGSPGGSPSQMGAPSQTGSPTRTGSNSQTVLNSKKGYLAETNSRVSKNSSAGKKSIRPSVSSSQRSSPGSNVPPLLASITNRRRLEEYTRGEIVEPTLASSTLDFAMIPQPPKLSRM